MMMELEIYISMQTKFFLYFFQIKFKYMWEKLKIDKKYIQIL